MDRIKMLRDRKAKLLSEADALGAKDAEGTLTAEELTRYSALLDTEIPAANASIAREEKLMDERRVVPSVRGANEDTDEETRDRTQQRAEPRVAKKFETFGEQMAAIVAAGQGVGIDSRLNWQAASGANEAGGGDGGYLIQQDFVPELVKKAYERADLANRTRRLTVGPRSNGIKINAIKETSRANGSRFGGIQAFWTGEGQQKTGSQLQFRQMDMRLHKLTGLAYATDEVLEDSVALESWIREAFADEFAFKLDDAIFEGTGTGMPLGFMNSAALITVAKEGSQAADTVVVENIVKMWARLWSRSKRTAVWLINQQITPQLFTMKIGDTPIYLPGGTIANAPFGQLLGRPIIETEFNMALGDKGDIVLADLNEYLMIEKGGLKQDTSIHARFINDETTFRFVYRADGQPIWEAPLTPFKGADTISPFVTLADRA